MTFNPLPDSRLNRTATSFDTVTGLRVDALCPTPESIRLADIAHVLSMQCRYGGHLRSHYSVAEHSVLVGELVRAKAIAFGLELHEACEAGLLGLAHDFTEAYVQDVIAPVKHALGDNYRRLEMAWNDVIMAKFELQATNERYELWVHEADVVIFVQEMIHLRGFAVTDIPKGAVTTWKEYADHFNTGLFVPRSRHSTRARAELMHALWDFAARARGTNSALCKEVSVERSRFKQLED